MKSDINLYAWWRILILTEREEGGPDWQAWAWDYIDAATRGLALDDERYGLHLWRGNMYFDLRREEEAMADVMTAIDYIDSQLPVVQRQGSRYYAARLHMERAQAYLLWEPDRALSIAKGVSQLNLNWQAPHYQSILMDIQRLVEKLAPPPPEPKEPLAKSGKEAPEAPLDSAAQKRQHAN
jgi:hypothetical protein